MMKVVLLTFVCMLFLFTPSPCSLPDVATADIEDINALVLISDGCGWNFFDVVDILESWGVNVTVISNTESHDVLSCPNHVPIDITADVLLSEFNFEDLANYDCVIVPAGGQWINLAGEPDVNEFLEAAYDEDLILSSICIGSKILAETNMFPNGTKVAMRYLVNSQWEAGGCIPIYAGVVSHNRVVTGETGSGFPDGYTGAPTYEVCAEVMREVVGLSRVAEPTFAPSQGTEHNNYTITVNLHNVSDVLTNISFGIVEEIEATIFAEESNESICVVELEYDANDDAFIGITPSLDLGNYSVNLEVRTEDNIVEVYTEHSFSVEVVVAEEGLSPFLIGTVIISTAGFVAVIVLYVIKFRRS